MVESWGRNRSPMRISSGSRCSAAAGLRLSINQFRSVPCAARRSDMWWSYDRVLGRPQLIADIIVIDRTPDDGGKGLPRGALGGRGPIATGEIRSLVFDRSLAARGRRVGRGKGLAPVERDRCR